MEIVFEFEKNVLVKIKDKYFWSRELSPESEICDCMNCHRLIGDDIPLRLWPEKGKKGELAFCHKCAEELGIMATLTKASE